MVPQVVSAPSRLRAASRRTYQAAAVAVVGNQIQTHHLNLQQTDHHTATADYLSNFIELVAFPISYCCNFQHLGLHQRGPLAATVDLK